MNPVLVWLLGAAGAVTAVGVLWRPARFAARLVRAFDEFLSDWHGEPGRPGVPARAGVLARLQVIEGELTYNGGQSLKDAVHRIEQQLCEEGS